VNATGGLEIASGRAVRADPSPALILARPHVSLWDGPAVAAWLARRRIRATFALDPEYASHPLLGKLIRSYLRCTGHPPFVPLDSSCPFAIRTLLNQVSAGRSIVLFPQGTGLCRAERPDNNGWQWLADRLADRMGRPPILELTLSHATPWPRIQIKKNQAPHVGCLVQFRSQPTSSRSER